MSAEQLARIQHAKPVCGDDRRHARRESRSCARGTTTFSVVWQSRLRLDSGPDAACRHSTATPTGTGTWASAGTIYRTRVLDGEPSTTLRLQEAGPIGRRFFINSRFLHELERHEHDVFARSADLIVNDAFTSGGAQLAGGRRTLHRLPAVGPRLRPGHPFVAHGDFARRRPVPVATIGELPGNLHVRDLDAFQAGLPRTFTRRIGDPNIKYWNLQAALVPAGRHPCEQEPDAQPGRSGRGPDAPE